MQVLFKLYNQLGYYYVHWRRIMYTSIPESKKIIILQGRIIIGISKRVMKTLINGIFRLFVNVNYFWILIPAFSDLCTSTL